MYNKILLPEHFFFLKQETLSCFVNISTSMGDTFLSFGWKTYLKLERNVRIVARSENYQFVIVCVQIPMFFVCVVLYTKRRRLVVRRQKQR
jgi:hypothetical protein